MFRKEQDTAIEILYERFTTLEERVRALEGKNYLHPVSQSMPRVRFLDTHEPYQKIELREVVRLILDYLELDLIGPAKQPARLEENYD